MENFQITNISLLNFKSFRDISLDLNKFNIIIGANASGKSNFLSFFKFLRDIIHVGLNDAISIQGGRENLINYDSSTNQIGFKIEFKIKSTYGISIKTIKEKTENIPTILSDNVEKDVKILGESGIYEVLLSISSENDVIIEKEEFISKNIASICDFDQKEEDESYVELPIGLLTKRIIRENSNVEVKYIFEDYSDLSKIFDDFFNFPLLSHPKKSKTHPKLLLESFPFDPQLFDVFSFFRNDFKIFDIDPKRSKSGNPFLDTRGLEPDGRNIALIIKKILNDPAKKRDFENLVNDILPFIEKFDVDRCAGNQFIFSIKEKNKENSILAPFLSDGTINVVSLIIALFFENITLKIFEEPERNIHPRLISHLLSSFREASEKNQIIITTHNPEFIKDAELGEIILIRRDEDGVSSIQRPINNASVNIFIQNNLGLHDLYIRDLL
jgi:predicted ATPase